MDYAFHQSLGWKRTLAPTKFVRHAPYSPRRNGSWRVWREGDKPLRCTEMKKMMENHWLKMEPKWEARGLGAIITLLPTGMDWPPGIPQIRQNNKHDLYANMHTPVQGKENPQFYSTQVTKDTGCIFDKWLSNTLTSHRLDFGQYSYRNLCWHLNVQH